MTLRAAPIEATIKVISPSCVKLKPQRSAVCRSLPARRTPSDEKIVLPMIKAAVSTAIGSAYLMIRAGSTIIPTETKKIPEKRSLTGVKSFFVVSVKAVPESSEPIRNAPNADEKPILVARTTMLRQRPSEKISSVSEVR